MLIKNKNNFTKILLFSNLTSILMFKECSFKLILFKKMGLKRNNIDIVLPKEELLTHEDLLVIDNLGRNL